MDVETGTSDLGAHHLVTQSLCFSYEGRSVIQNLDLKIPRGRITALLGISGSGKSTIVKLLTGLLQPTSGCITFSESAGTRLGAVFQDSTLLPWKTLRSNLELAARSGADTREVAEMVGIADALDKYPHQCSGGMLQRAEFGRLMMVRPDVIVLDEPFNRLDVHFRGAIHRVFLDVFESYRPTSLLVTHDIDEAWELADEVLVLKGRPGSAVERIHVEADDALTYREKTRSSLQEEFARFGAADS